MIDEIVKFETARLAREKGFPQELGSYHYDHVFDNELTYGRATEQSFSEDMTAAPTQSLLQRWLREKHDIHCVIEVGTRNGNNVFEANLRSDSFDDEQIDESESSEYTFNTYEKALEDCLVDALNCI